MFRTTKAGPSSNKGQKDKKGKKDRLRIEFVPGKEPGSLVENLELEEVKVGKRLGKGGFGTVYSGKLGKKRVAVKMFVPHDQKQISQEEGEKRKESCHKEAEMMARLKGHPNITELVGVAKFAFVMACANTSLDRLLFGEDVFYLQVLCNFAKNIVAGLEYLHELGIVHRDIKPGNVLVFGKSPRVAKLGDFGLAKLDSELSECDAAGTPSWMAPEVLINLMPPEDLTNLTLPEALPKKGKRSFPSDIYALALLLYALMTREKPYEKLMLKAPHAQKKKGKEAKGKEGVAKNDFITNVLEAITREERPKIPNYTPEKVQEIIAQSWSTKPVDRLEVTEIRKKLETVIVKGYDENIPIPPPCALW